MPHISFEDQSEHQQPTIFRFLDTVVLSEPDPARLERFHRRHHYRPLGVSEMPLPGPRALSKVPLLMD